MPFHRVLLVSNSMCGYFERNSIPVTHWRGHTLEKKKEEKEKQKKQKKIRGQPGLNQ